VRCAKGLIAKNKGEGTPQDLEQQDLEEKLLHVSILYIPFLCSVIVPKGA